MSPESTWSTRSERARSRLRMYERRATPPTFFSSLSVPRPSVESICRICRSYGKMREWMSDEWSNVSRTSHVCPSGHGDWGPVPPVVQPGAAVAARTSTQRATRARTIAKDAAA
jgi:hypothetical protein